MESNSQIHLGDLGIVDRIVGGWLIGWPGAGVGGAGLEERRADVAWLQKRKYTWTDPNCRPSAWRVTAQDQACWDRRVQMQGGNPRVGGEGDEQPCHGLNRVLPAPTHHSQCNSEVGHSRGR